MACCSTHGAGSGSDMVECGDCGTMMEKLYWERFIPLHFCQILSPGSDFHHKLEIPLKFAKNARVLLHPEVTLRGPSGAPWRAIMTMIGNHVFLADGWEEFVRAYSLQEGNILIFKYDRASLFDVLIFEGDNLCEKEAAYFVQKREKAKPFVDPQRKINTRAETEEPNDIHIHRAAKKAKREVRKCKVPKTTKFSHLYFNRRRKKRVHFKSVSSKANTRQSIRLATSLSAGDPHVILAEQGKSPVIDAPANQENVHRTLPTEAQQDVSKNTNPFAEEPQNAETDGSPETETEPPNGNNVHWTFANEPLQDVPEITGGWLIEDDSPREDAPQINKSTNVDEVSPLAGKETDGGSPIESTYPERRVTRQQRAAKENHFGTTDPSSQNFPSGSGKGTEEMASSQGTQSSFMVVMRSTALKHFQVYIPNDLYEKHQLSQIQHVFLRIGDETWLARLGHRTRPDLGIIRKGWKQFVQGNRLEVHDVCLFKIASKTVDTVILDVSIFRATRAGEPDELSSTT